MESERQTYARDSEIRSLKVLLQEALYRANMAMHDEEYDEAERLLAEGEGIRSKLRDLDPSYLESEAERLTMGLHEDKTDKN